MESSMIRIYKREDHAKIAEIFCRAIHEIAITEYTHEQCLAWSSPQPNPGYWKNRCELKKPFIAEIKDEIAGFLELDTDGHIDCAYVNPDFQRRKVMTNLVVHAIKAAKAMKIRRVYTEASLCLKPLLEGLGFHVEAEHEVQICEQYLKNFTMVFTPTMQNRTTHANPPPLPTAGRRP